MTIRMIELPRDLKSREVSSLNIAHLGDVEQRTFLK